MGRRLIAVAAAVLVLGACTPTVTTTADPVTSSAPDASEPTATAAPGDPVAALTADLAEATSQPLDPVSAARAVERVSADLAAAYDSGVGEQASAEVERAVLTALGTEEGRAALLATTNALAGAIVPLASPASEPDRASRASRRGVPALPGAAGVHGYFVNGVLNTWLDAVVASEAVADAVGHRLDLVYNTSLKETDIELVACTRLLAEARRGTPYDPDESWVELLAELAAETATAAAAEACRLVQSPVNLANLTKWLALGVFPSAELVQQRLGVEGASGALAARLAARVDRDAAAGRDVVLVAHSQGTMFVRDTLALVDDDWRITAPEDTECPDRLVDAGPPVGAVYVSPAFPAENADRTRYVMLRGDVLNLGFESAGVAVGPVPATAEPTGEQRSFGMFRRHELATYLMPGTETRTQVRDGFDAVVDALSQRRDALAEDCPTASPSPSSPSASAVEPTGETRRYEGTFDEDWGWETITYEILANQVDVTVYPDGRVEGHYVLSWSQDNTAANNGNHCVEVYSAAGRLLIERGPYGTGTVDASESEPERDGCEWYGPHSMWTSGVWQLDSAGDQEARGGVDVYGQGFPFTLQRVG